MLYVFHGTDEQKSRDQVDTIVDSLKQRREYAQVFNIYVDTFSPENIQGIQSSSGLFFDKHVFIYRGLLKGLKDVKTFILENIETFVASPHVHIIIEGAMDESHIKQIKKYDEVKIKENALRSFAPVADISKKMFDTVSNIVASKKQKSIDKKIQVWKQVDEIRMAGTAPEEFFGILWWAGKQKGLSQEDMKTILDIYHDDHNGEGSMWEGLEAWVLR